MSADTYFLPNDFDRFEGTTLGQGYKVEALLGEGCYGFVTKCIDTKTNKAVAIKVNKNDPDVLEEAKSEIFILGMLKRLDPDSCNIIKWNGFFVDRERICLNFELLDQSLYDYMQDRKNHSLPVSELRPVVYQLTNALSHLSAIGIVHTDLKLDNVMVMDRHQSPIKVKVIDFGLASLKFELDQRVPVQSYWYRAPEVMVHAPFDQAIDMWSLGLIAAELATGYPLYPGEIEYDVLRYIIQTQGQPPDCVLDRGLCTHHFFREENHSNQRWRFKSEEEFKRETGLQPQETRYVMMEQLDRIKKIMIMETGKQSGQDLFVSLIKEMMHLDANQRITPSEALQHPFFDPIHSQSSSGSEKRRMLDERGRGLVQLEAENAVLLEEKEQLKAMIETAKEEPEKAKAASEDKQRMYTEASLKLELEAALSSEKQQKSHIEKFLAKELAKRQKEELTEAQSELEEEKHERELDRSRLLAEHSKTTSVIKAAAMKAQEDLEKERCQWLQEKSSLLAAVTALKQSLAEKDQMIADLMNKVKNLEPKKKKPKKRTLWQRFVGLFRRS